MSPASPPSEPPRPEEAAAPTDFTTRSPPPSPLPPKVRVRAAIERGLTVNVLAGPFEGKVGVVQELDGKGAARVVLGTLSTWVPVSDLTHGTAGKERPWFRSSHRKPGRSRPA